jgi:hypothetical protein
MLPNLKLVDWRQTINFLINNDQIKKNTHPVAETYSNYQFNTESNGNLEISSKQQYTTTVMSYYDYNNFLFVGGIRFDPNSRKRGWLSLCIMHVLISVGAWINQTVVT